MKYTLFLSSFLLFACPVSAQQVRAKVPVEPIAYIGQVPAAVARQMPKRGKSCFYGSFKLKNQKLFLHLFNPDPQQKATGRFPVYKLMLHILKASGKSGRQFRLVKAIRVDYRSLIGIWGPNKFGAQLLWLDPNQKSQPILKLDCFLKSNYGNMGDHVLVVFPDGFAGKAIVQSLAFGSWQASDARGQSTTFNDMDEKGLLELHTSLFPANGEPVTEWILRWNGKEFYSVNGPVKGVGIEPGLPYP